MKYGIGHVLEMTSGDLHKVTGIMQTSDGETYMDGDTKINISDVKSLYTLFVPRKKAEKKAEAPE